MSVYEYDSTSYDYTSMTEAIEKLREAILKSNLKLEDVSDEQYMFSCWKRTKDTDKCEHCEFKFQCLTVDWKGRC